MNNEDCEMRSSAMRSHASESFISLQDRRARAAKFEGFLSDWRKKLGEVFSDGGAGIGRKRGRLVFNRGLSIEDFGRWGASGGGGGGGGGGARTPGGGQDHCGGGGRSQDHGLDQQTTRGLTASQTTQLPARVPKRGARYWTGNGAYHAVERARPKGSMIASAPRAVGPGGERTGEEYESCSVEVVWEDSFSGGNAVGGTIDGVEQWTQLIAEKERELRTFGGHQ